MKKYYIFSFFLSSLLTTYPSEYPNYSSNQKDEYPAYQPTAPLYPQLDRDPQSSYAYQFTQNQPMQHSAPPHGYVDPVQIVLGLLPGNPALQDLFASVTTRLRAARGQGIPNMSSARQISSNISTSLPNHSMYSHLPTPSFDQKAHGHKRERSNSFPNDEMIPTPNESSSDDDILKEQERRVDTEICGYGIEKLIKMQQDELALLHKAITTIKTTSEKKVAELSHIIKELLRQELGSHKTSFIDRLKSDITKKSELLAQQMNKQDKDIKPTRYRMIRAIALLQHASEKNRTFVEKIEDL